MTEELKQEIEKLKAKNAELLDEKKATKARDDEQARELYSESNG